MDPSTPELTIIQMNRGFAITLTQIPFVLYLPHPALTGKDTATIRPALFRRSLLVPGRE